MGEERLVPYIYNHEYRMSIRQCGRVCFVSVGGLVYVVPDASVEGRASAATLNTSINVGWSTEGLHGPPVVDPGDEARPLGDYSLTPTSRGWMGVLALHFKGAGV